MPQPLKKCLPFVGHKVFIIAFNVRITSLKNLAYTVTASFSEVRFNIMITPTPKFRKQYRPLIFSG